MLEKVHCEPCPIPGTSVSWGPVSRPSGVEVASPQGGRFRLRAPSWLAWSTGDSLWGLQSLRSWIFWSPKKQNFIYKLKPPDRSREWPQKKKNLYFYTFKGPSAFKQEIFYKFSFCPEVPVVNLWLSSTSPIHHGDLRGRGTSMSPLPPPQVRQRVLCNRDSSRPAMGSWLRPHPAGFPYVGQKMYFLVHIFCHISDAVNQKSVISPWFLKGAVSRKCRTLLFFCLY